MVLYGSVCVTAISKDSPKVSDAVYFELCSNFGISQLNCLGWSHVLEAIKIRADIAEKYLENILSFCEATKWNFRKFPSKAGFPL